MNLWSAIFRRGKSIATASALADFIDEQSAFLVQKGIYEYSRARAGHYAKVLFSEQAFLDAIERSRWSAYPLGLAMVGELVEGVLCAQGQAAVAAQPDHVRALVLAVFDRYPTPASHSAQEWSDARGELARRLQLVSLHPPKRAMDIPAPLAKIYFDLMPIHEKLRGRDFPTTHNYLKVTMCNVHDVLTRRMDMPALAHALAKDAPPA
ncbi:MAG: hypothetical protein K2X43_21690 [Hyphomonadaceae bacterium]|jgi:hypothetical protein|nr:hypothetical protein [Hyphomonadaceae bacterium]